MPRFCFLIIFSLKAGLRFVPYTMLVIQLGDLLASPREGGDRSGPRSHPMRLFTPGTARLTT